MSEAEIVVIPQRPVVLGTTELFVTDVRHTRQELLVRFVAYDTSGSLADRGVLLSANDARGAELEFLGSDTDLLEGYILFGEWQFRHREQLAGPLTCVLYYDDEESESDPSRGFTLVVGPPIGDRSSHISKS